MVGSLLFTLVTVFAAVHTVQFDCEASYQRYSNGQTWFEREENRCMFYNCDRGNVRTVGEGCPLGDEVCIAVNSTLDDGCRTFNCTEMVSLNGTTRYRAIQTNQRCKQSGVCYEEGQEMWNRCRKYRCTKRQYRMRFVREGSNCTDHEGTCYPPGVLFSFRDIETGTTYPNCTCYFSGRNNHRENKQCNGYDLFIGIHFTPTTPAAP